MSLQQENLMPFELETLGDQLALYHNRPIQPARVAQPDAARLYDKIAPVYDLWARLTETKARNRALSLAKIEEGQNVLEVAVGTGLAFAEIVKANTSGRNVGIDLSPGMLAKAERRLNRTGLTNYDLSCGSAYDLPEEDEAFDVVLNNYMFDLLEQDDWPRVLSEFHRVLKPNGLLVLANMTLGEKIGSGIYDRIYRISPRLMGGCRGVRLTQPLEENGFIVRQREYFQSCLFPSEVVIAVKDS